MTIDVIGVIRMSIQSFTKLVGNGSSPMTCMDPTAQDGAPHRLWHKLGSARPSWYQEDSVHTSVSQRGRNSEWWRFYSWKWAESVRWSGRFILGQQCKILLNAFRNDQWSPQWSAIICRRTLSYCRGSSQSKKLSQIEQMMLTKVWLGTNSTLSQESAPVCRRVYC